MGRDCSRRYRCWRRSPKTQPNLVDLLRGDEPPCVEIEPTRHCPYSNPDKNRGHQIDPKTLDPANPIDQFHGSNMSYINIEARGSYSGGRAVNNSWNSNSRQPDYQQAGNHQPTCVGIV